MEAYLRDVLKKCGGGCARKETRVRNKNVWIIETCVKKAPQEWCCAVLPCGRRVLAVRFDNRLSIFERHSPETGPIGNKVTQSGPNFVADTVDGYHIFDVLAVGAETVTHLPLPERLSKFPLAGTLFDIIPYMPYIPHVTIKSDDLRPNKRLLIVKSDSPYTSITKDAITWKQPYAHTLAVLCCRLGKVCAVVDDTSSGEYLLHEEGDIEEESKTAYMKTYLCRYSSRTRKWSIIREAKKSEPIYTTIQTLRSVAGIPQNDPVFG